METVMNEQNRVRVRFAPSPTGYLHIGGLRTALFNWLFARHHDGAFLLRIEDTDTERSKEEYVDAICASLAWVGLKADEPMVIQSQRIDEHKKILGKLVADGKAYRCFCTQDEIVNRYEQKTAGDFFVKYDGHCRKESTNRDLQQSHVIRFKLPLDKVDISFDDLIRGRVTIGLDQLDDFIIARSDGRPMYNFVVVIDDAFMRISHVIRGEDHIANTSKQLLLYQALGYEVPQFAHIPLILGPSGDRLSKRDGAVSALEYRCDGYLPEALVNYLVRLGWSHGDQEIFTAQELIDYFSLDHVGKKGAIFDPEKLAWVNSIYMRDMSPDQLHKNIITNVQPDFSKQLSAWDQRKIEQGIELFKERVKTLKQLVSDLTVLHNGPQVFATEDVKKWISSDTPNYIRAIIETLEAQQSFEHDDLIVRFKELAKQLEVKLVTIAQPIRIALIGKASGPGVFGLLEMVGKTESISRIRILSKKIRML